jgi:8-oxo-dGTP pyrophosphatase MutT (NUDIX family)
MAPPLPPRKILSCGIVVIHFDGERYRLLAIRGFASWDFPKALVSGSQDPWQVAMNEAREATGLGDLELSWGDDAARETIASEDGSVSRYYLAQSKSAAVTLRVPLDSDPEDFEYRWVTLEEAEEILPPRLALVLDWVAQQLASGAG